MRGMGSLCAFCPGLATTREHLWDDWVSKLLGEDKRYIIRRNMQGKALKWKSVGLKEKTLVLCDDCNHTWGSALGAKMKDVVADMITEGAATRLNESDVAVIAAYSQMKAFVCDYMQEDVQSFYDSRDRHAFRADLAYPRGLCVWLAWTEAGHGIFKGAYSKAPLETPGRFQIYIFTMSIGQLVIQVTCPRWTKKSNRKYAKPPTLDQSPFWQRFSTMIWPNCVVPVSWPPIEQLRYEQVDAFVDRWRRLNRAV